MVDASVALRWFLETPLSAKAMKLLKGDAVLLAPDLVAAEVANAAWKLANAGQFEVTQGAGAASAVSTFFDRLVPSSELAAGAYAIATELRHPAYDCFYLRLAELESVRLLTTDKRLIRSVRGSRWEGLPLRLESFSDL